jgi:AcrR family transcriptional regulator
VKREQHRARLRLELVEAAARLIAAEGAEALTLRRLAQETGTSTMAVYTNFGGMPELRHAVRREGFSRLAARLAEVGHSDDTVADLSLLGLAYYGNATDNADLYRVMFMEPPLDAADAEIGWETFDALVTGVQRCISDGRLVDVDAGAVATQLWGLAHGLVSLELAALLDRGRALTALGSAAFALFTASGDDPDKTRISLIDSLRRSGLEAPQRRRRSDAS